jgi:hypothetical protein
VVLGVRVVGDVRRVAPALLFAMIINDMIYISDSQMKSIFFYFLRRMRSVSSCWASMVSAS